MQNPAFQDDDISSPTTLEMQPSKRAPSPTSPTTPNTPTTPSTPGVVVADCSSCCLPLPALNRFRSPRWFLVFLSLAATVQGICVNGLVNVVITSIERRFNLQSTQSGTIASSYDIGSLICMIPISYLGGRLGASKPRWIAAGMLSMALGSLVWTLPHFSTPTYQAVGTEEQEQVLCSRERGEEECREEEGGGSGLSSYRFVFVLGQLLHGMGAAPLITLGTTFLDESVSKRSSPLYIAVFQTWFVIGPAIGFVLGGSLLSLHTDLSSSSSSITPSSSLWVGAWWPGFLLTFLLSIICALTLQCFPASINRKRDTSLASKEAESKLQPLPAALWALCSNPTYLAVSLAGGVDGLIVSGLSAFLPKFIEQQYSLSNGLAAQLVGLIVVPAGGGGTFFGGWLIKRLNLGRHGIILMCFVSQMVTIPTLLAYLLTCSGPAYSGLHTSPTPAPAGPYYPALTPAAPDPFTAACNSECSCPAATFDPVCGADGLMYISPCHAGCSAEPGPNNFTDCACVEGGLAERKTCTTECNFLIPYIIIQFLGIFMTFFATMPSVVASLRAVRPEERSLALGVQSIILRVFGTIPGPILFGAFMDKACTLWEQEECGERGSCLLYDNHQMAVSMIGICVTAKIVSILFFFIGWVFSKRSSIQDLPEGEEEVVEVVGGKEDGLRGEQVEAWRRGYVPYEEPSK